MHTDISTYIPRTLLTVAGVLCVFHSVGAAAEGSESAWGGKLYMECYKNGLVNLSSPNFRDKMDLQAPPGTISEMIDVNALIRHDGDDNKGAPYRTGSNVVEKSCGPVHVKISGGYYNSNPQGANGGDDNFPVVSIRYGNTDLVDGYKIGGCTPGNWPNEPDCPEKWSPKITVYPKFSGERAKSSPDYGKVHIEFERHYTEHKIISLTQGNGGKE